MCVTYENPTKNRNLLIGLLNQKLFKVKVQGYLICQMFLSQNVVLVTVNVCVKYEILFPYMTRSRSPSQMFWYDNIELVMVNVCV